MPRNNLNLSAVIDAATKLADADGLQQLSIKKLADILDVKPPALYNHVDSLANLQSELALQGLSMLRERLLKAAVGKSKHDALQAAGRAYLAFAKEHPGLYEATQYVNAWQSDKRVTTASEEVLAVIDTIIEPYHFNEADRIDVIRAFRGLCHGFASLDAGHGFGNPLVDSATSFAAALDMLLEGIDRIYSRKNTDG